MKRLSSLIFIIACTFSACSPNLNKRDFSAPIMDLKPDLESDPDFAKLFQNVNQFEMQWRGQVNASEVHEVIQGLLELSDRYQNSDLKNVALAIYNKYIAKQIGTRVSFFKTPYYELFQAEALPSVREAIKDGGKKLDGDLADVKIRVKDLKIKFDWPKKAKFKESIKLLEHFLDTFSELVQKMNLTSDFQEALLKEIKEEKNVNVAYLNKQLSEIESRKTLESMILILEGMIKEFDISLDKEATSKLESGRKLTVKINQIQDEQTAFSAVIAVWKVLAPTERELYFTPISAGLFKFLTARTDEELDCLDEKSCPGLMTALIRDWAVLPQIKKFGAEKIKVILNEKTHGYVLEILEERLLNVVTNLDSRITKKLERNVNKARSELEILRKNAKGYTKEKFLGWLKRNLDQSSDLTNAFDYSLIDVDMQKRDVSFRVPDQAKNIISSRVVGASLGAHALLLDSGILTEKNQRRVILEQVNRVMGFGGLPTKMSVTKGITRNFENDPTTYDIGKALGSFLSYGLNDRINLISPYVAKETSDPADLTAQSQIEVGKGLLFLMKYLRDWEKNSFDSLLGTFRASDVFGGQKTLNEPKLFSKTDFFGLVTAQFLNWISNLNKKYSQIGLVSDSNEVVWLNEYAKNKDKTLLYGIYVDIFNGQKSSEVSLEPMVKLIRLLKSMTQAVQGIERTRFKELLRKDITDPECSNLSAPTCPTQAQVIANKINEIKRIILPLGNTIATKFRRQKGSANAGMSFGKISLPSLEFVEKTPILMDQLLVIEALVNVYESTRIESYIWAAKETFSLLQKYYNPKTNFFDMDAKIASVPVVIQMLRSFKLMIPYLEETESIILKEKVKIWEYSLARVQ